MSERAGIPWYRAEDYRQILQIMADGATLPATYHQWRAEAEHYESDVKRLGQEAVRAIIDPEIFPHWCNDRHLRIDAEARRAFANEVANRRTS